VIDSVFCQDYSFHGFNLNYTSATDINYDRIFCFVDINEEHLLDKTKFIYEIITSDTELTLKGPFHFNSEIYEDEKPEHKIITYGDTDTYLHGMPTLDRMKEEEYDLLVLLGDYSYDIFDNNGQKGDDFFEAMEPILTKAPFVLTPGNHETADDSKLLNSRFVMPGTSKENHTDNNYYSFIAGKVLYISMNLDYIAFTNVVRISEYTERLYLELLEKHKGRGIDWYYMAFFTHRPFYNIERAQRAMVDLYTSLPILTVLNDFGVDIILTGHTHDFELSRIYNDYMPTPKSDNTLMIISGAAGTDKDPMDSDRYYNMPFNVEYIPGVNGLVELKISKSDINGTFFKVNDRDTLYKFNLKGISTFEADLFMIIGFFILVLAIVIGMAILLYKYITDDDMEEVDKQADKGHTMLDDEENGPVVEEKLTPEEAKEKKEKEQMEEVIDAFEEA
jgi:predicted phosphodiesterase